MLNTILILLAFVVLPKKSLSYLTLCGHCSWLWPCLAYVDSVPVWLCALSDIIRLFSSFTSLLEPIQLGCVWVNETEEASASTVTMFAIACFAPKPTPPRAGALALIMGPFQDLFHKEFSMVVVIQHSDMSYFFSALIES